MTELDNKDLEFIQNKFDADGLRAPESLSKENILAMLEAEEAKNAPRLVNAKAGAAAKANKAADAVGFKPAKPRRSLRKQLLSLTACLLIAVITVPIVNHAMNQPPDTSMVDGELRTFTSERQIKRLVRSMNQYYYSGGFGYYVKEEYDMGMAVEEDREDSAPVAVAANDSAKGDDFSETYKQVEGVDEADIIKTDGKYVYLVTAEREIAVWSAADGKAREVGMISDFNEDGYINNIYLYNNKLVAVGTLYTNDSKDSERSYVKIYDVSDPKHPELLKEFKQSGYVRTSRLTGGVVYLITNYYADRDRYIPYVTRNGSYETMGVNDICTFPDPQNSSYIVVSSIDVDDGKEIRSKSKAIFGSGDTVYCNTEHLYLAETQYRYITTEDGSSNQITTLIAKVNLNGGKLEFAETGKVRGSLYGQFALDEKDGYLRVATTSNKSGKDVNNLFVLDSSLEEVGRVTGFARNEHIEAVRFIGDKGYVITFERTDPLFVLDLSDPTAPAIDGEVEIEGFSTLLAPVGENRLVGIGYRTAENEYGGIYTDGLKIALVDISNPSEPKVLDSKEYKETSSVAPYDHHGLLQNKGAGYLAIPYYFEHYEYYDEEPVEVEEDVIIEESTVDAEDTIAATEPAVPAENERHGGVLVFKAGDKLEIVDDHIIGEDGVKRCIYIGDYIYAADDFDMITGFKYVG